MENIPQNSGVLDRAPQPGDWIAGKESGITFEDRVKDGNWTPFLPTPERQSGRRMDTMACVTFSALNCIETQINWMIAQGLIPDKDLTMLKVLNYIDKNGKFNCSDRFTAKMSGTTPQGNYLTNVWQSIHRDGLAAESDWPADLENFDWTQYYAEVSEGVKNKAARILEIFDFNYEYAYTGNGDAVQELRDHLPQAPLQIASPVCTPWAAGPIKACGKLNPEHATMVYGLDIERNVKIEDQYAPFEKTLDRNYRICYVMKGIVTLKSAAPHIIKPVHTFATDIEYGTRSAEVTELQTALKFDNDFPADVLATGYYGEITRQAVLAFQRKYKVAPAAELDALQGRRVGAKTRAVLNDMFAQ